jgi:hypothetical protein
MSHIGLFRMGFQSSSVRVLSGVFLFPFNFISVSFAISFQLYARLKSKSVKVTEYKCSAAVSQPTELDLPKPEVSHGSQAISVTVQSQPTVLDPAE